MSKAYLIGHGIEDIGLEPAWVPPEKTLHFYLPEGADVSMAVIPGILAAGDIAPVQSYPGGKQVPNCLLKPYNPDERASVVGSVSAQLKGRLLFVGSPPLAHTDQALFLSDGRDSSWRGPGWPCAPEPTRAAPTAMPAGVRGCSGRSLTMRST